MMNYVPAFINSNDNKEMMTQSLLNRCWETQEGTQTIASDEALQL